MIGANPFPTHCRGQDVTSANAFRATSTSTRPIVQAWILNTVGEGFFHSRHGRFTLSKTYITKVARAAGLSFTKPYGDSRQLPADADEQIHNFVLRMQMKTLLATAFAKALAMETCLGTTRWIYRP